MVKVCDKRKFKTKQQAKLAAKIMKKKGLIYPSEDLHTYRCEQCLSWHNSKLTINEYVKKYNESKLETIERLIKNSKNLK